MMPSSDGGSQKPPSRRGLRPLFSLPVIRNADDVGELTIPTENKKNSQEPVRGLSIIPRTVDLSLQAIMITSSTCIIFRRFFLYNIFRAIPSSHYVSP